MDFKIQFYDQGTKFLKDLRLSLNESFIQIPENWDVDHICYRTASIETYRSICSELEKFGRLLVESIVNGRPIATYKLQDPFYFDERFIDVVEVPAPKAGKFSEDGFEHVEIVADVPFEKLEKDFAQFNLNLGGLKKPFNQELEVCLPKVNFKFHQLSLESVIRLECSSVYPVLRRLQILEKLSEFSPLIAGTYPLGLENEKSDVDVILTMKNRLQLRNEIENQFSELNGFTVREYDLDGVETLQANFEYEGVQFELFAQPTPSVQQTGYLHFLIEERLLKLGGESLRHRVLQLRGNGVKTEPAFAKALGIQGDPYEELLSLQKMSDLEIRNRLYFQEK